MRQRVRAAILALELDTAREILDRAPESLRNEPEARYQLAWIELRSGRIERVEEITAGLLEDPGVKARPRLRARILTMRGFLSSLLEEDITAGESFYDSALDALESVPATAEHAANPGTIVSVTGGIHPLASGPGASRPGPGHGRPASRMGRTRL